MTRRFTTSLVIAVTAAALILTGCGDDSSENEATGTPPAAATSTAAGTATATQDGTGVTIADRVVDAIAADDADALAALMETQMLPCSNAAGVGGPPPCSGAPGSPPEGTEVAAIAYLTCEREWQFDLAVFARRFLDAAGELYAVVRVERLDPAAELPASTSHAVIFTSQDTAFEGAHALLVSDDAIVAADSLCGGAPADFLEDGPPLFAPAVVYEGPAFDR